MQAQDARAARLAIRARSTGLRASDVDRALTDDRSLVVAWLCRGTLHLVGRDDYAWLLALTAPPRMTANARRLGQEGVPPADADRALAIIESALGGDGPLTRAQLAERLAAAGIRTEGQATPHLLMLAALRGVAVLGPVHDEGAQAFALARDWFGAPAPEVDRDAALRELARRYLRGHGPAGAADLAAWSGLPLRDARAGLSAIASELEERNDGLVDLAQRPCDAAPPPPRLLGAFDPYLLGYKDRAFVVPAEHARHVHPGGGIIRAVALVDGVAAATWTMRRGEIAIEPFADLPSGALDDERADVERFLDG